MDMESVIKSATREIVRSPDTMHMAEVQDIMTGLDIGVRNVELRADGIHVLMDEGWEALDASWGPEDSIAVMFNAMESAGYRHVPGTSRFMEDGTTRFVKDGMAFDFAAPQLDWEADR